MGQPLARWRALSGRQQWQLVLLMIALPVTGGLIRVFGFQRTAKIFARLGGQAPLRPSTAQDLAEAENFASLAAIAGRRGPVTATCLRQSLVVRAWLRRRGLDAHLKIGVRKTGSALDAHAWVELDGHPLAQPTPRHAPFQSPNPL